MKNTVIEDNSVIKGGDLKDNVSGFETIDVSAEDCSIPPLARPAEGSVLVVRVTSATYPGHLVARPALLEEEYQVLLRHLLYLCQG